MFLFTTPPPAKMLFPSALVALTSAVSLVAAKSSSSKKPAAKISDPTNTFTPTNYTVVTGLFEQDSSSFNVTAYDQVADAFGIVDRSSKRWTSLEAKVAQLNAAADSHTAYKLLYLARHGDGYHNQAQTTYG